MPMYLTCHLLLKHINSLILKRTQPSHIFLTGTKRIPGSQASRVGPRTVKTYQERLKEMKQARTAQPGPIRRYAGPIPGEISLH